MLPLPALSDDSATIRFRLTALWALSESGLGGLLHAFNVPFSGSILGAFSVVTLTILAYHTPPSERWKTIIQATFLVIIVKALASPHTPPLAYLAVGFQGLVAALLFSVLPFQLAACLTGILALVESAMQKLLVMTLIFGMPLWKAIDVFFGQLMGNLGIDNPINPNLWLIGIYLLIQGIWGLFWGNYAANLARKLPTLAEPALVGYETLVPSVVPARKSRFRHLIALGGIGFFIVATLLLTSNIEQALFALLRTLAAVALLWLFRPMYLRLMNKWVAQQKIKQGEAIQQTINLLPELRTYIQPAQVLASSKKGIGFVKAFLQNLLILAIYAPTPSQRKQ